MFFLHNYFLICKANRGFFQHKMIFNVIFQNSKDWYLFSCENHNKDLFLDFFSENVLKLKQLKNKKEINELLNTFLDARFQLFSNK